MQHVYVISDTHFGHRRILEFETAHRPFQTIEEHDTELVAARSFNLMLRHTI